MPQHSETPAQVAFSLSARLQDVTEALAAARTREQVLDVVLPAALEAVDALGGAAVMVQAGGEALELVVQRGELQEDPTFWQAAPLGGHSPAGDALLGREALYFEHRDELLLAYPALEAHSGAAAMAALPMLLDGAPLGVLVVEFTAPHTFTPDERRFLRILAAQCAVALGRAQLTVGLEDQVQQRTAQLEQEVRAQAAFIEFTEAVGTQTDVLALAEQAFALLRLRFQHLSSGYYVLDDDRWTLQVHTDDLYASPALLGVLRAGLPRDTPSLLTMVQDRAAVFTDAQELERDGIEYSGAYGAGGSYPLMLGGEVRAFLGVGLTDQRRWSELDRALVRAVGRGLQLALERTELARALVVQNAELDARTRALEGFAELTRDLSQPGERLTLVRRAQEIVAQMIPQGFAVYYELEGECWQLQSQVGSPDNPTIQASLESALPYALVQNFQRPWESGLPFYQDAYDPALDDGVPGVEALASTATLPLLVGTRRQGIFGYGLTLRRAWSGADRAVLETLVRSLGLALERAEQTHQLEEERAALDAFVAFSEASANATDLHALARQAVDVLQATLGDVSVVYYDLEDDLWKARVWSDDLAPEVSAVLAAGIPVDAPSYAEVRRTRQMVLVPDWDAEHEGVANSDAYGAGAFYPCLVGTELRGLLAMGTQRAKDWTAREREVFRAVGRSLQVALERSDTARSLQAQNAELAAQARALEGFAALTREQAVQRDPYALIRRAQDVVLSQLSAGYALYYEVDGERWRARVQVGDLGNADLQAFVDAGPRVGEIPSLDRPWTRRETLYQDVYAQGSDTPVELVEHVNAVACLPLLLGSEPVGIFAVGLFEQRIWTRTDRVILEAVVGSLGLALERAEGVRQLAEERAALDVRTWALEAANEELEAFSYSVSHDLRAPVRHIKGFNDLLRKAAGPQLDAKSTRYLNIVDEAAGRMSTLIDALLDLSRTSRQPLRLGPVNLEALVAATCLEVEADAQGRDVVWALQPLPQVMGDQDTLRQVVINLLSNALKYSRTADQAVIEVWAEARPGEWAVFVRDNGVGFDPRYGDKLFGVFQRLHRAEDFEGTGVGLANVRRIITRHGGTVFAHSGEGPGATFGFTLPRAP